MTNLLYVCEYNVIRSPVAEQITRNKINNDKLNISSAGLSKLPYNIVSSEMIDALKRLGYPIVPHTTRMVDRDSLLEQDLVLCMTDGQVQRILDMAPELKTNATTLPAYAGFPGEHVYGLSEKIKEIPAFFLLTRLPYKLRRSLYRRVGYVDPRDYEGVVEVHIDIAKKIEMYADRAVDRMRREGLISTK